MEDLGPERWDPVAEEIESEIRDRGPMTLREIQSAVGKPETMAGACTLLMEGRIRENWNLLKKSQVTYVLTED
jgi:hypothetical protein